MRNIPGELVTKYEAEGWWTRDTIGDLLARGLAAAPDTEFRVHSATRPWSGTFGDVELVARKLAGGLRSRGVGPGDVVAFQLPNWMEAAAIFWASSLLGATVAPIVHFYGRKELEFILGDTKPTVLITAEGFGRTEFHEDLCADVAVVGVVGGAGSHGRAFENLLATDPLPGVVAVDPAEPALIAFTSGTTSSPKGVVHSHQTLGHETRQLAGLYPPDRGRQLTAAPVGHFIGMINAFLIPVLDGTAVNLTDNWDPAQALALMESDGLTVGGGATYFVTSLLDHPDFTRDHIPYMKYAGLGGSSVPAAVTTRLDDLGITVFRSYGSTEHPSITGSRHTAPTQKRLFTDGDPLPGVEIRLAEDGEILSRGPDLCIGYTDLALTEKAFDAEGWYHTGDIGVLDDDGYLTITDRKSDIIIRGGENISALEVEEVLLSLPGVAEAVVVATPDDRLGERAAAVVRMRPGQPAPTMADLREHFDGAGLAKQKWPERLHQVEDFPRTASGKIQKFVVRHDIATLT
ncbi:AMP-binding protein [Rhodococcus triatomae]|nr:AMP-dependent synthetase and ligase [Rhodococcus triatomae BKS 15-14]